jgi:hypothetical protein
VRKRFPALRQPLPPAPWTVLLINPTPRAGHGARAGGAAAAALEPA